MSLEIPENQPIIFNHTANECIFNPDFNQLVGQTDTSQIQVFISPCPGSEELLNDPSFAEYPTSAWNFDGAFAQGAHGICKSSGSSGSAKQFGSLTIGTVVQLTISVTSIFGIIELYNGPNLIGTIDSTGDAVFTFTVTSPDIRIAVNDADHTACILSTSAMSIDTGFLVAIRRVSDNTVVDSYTIASNPDRFVFYKNSLTISVPWEEFSFPDGCYFISLDDACTNTCGQIGLFNDELLNEEGWVSDESGVVTVLTISEGSMAVAVDGGYELIVRNEVTNYCAGKQYSIKVTINNAMDAGHEIIFSIGGTNSATFTTSGIKTFSITPITDGNLIIRFLSSSTQMLQSLIGLSVELVNSSDYTFLYDSIPLKLGTFECSMLVNISNDNDAFGFNFVNTGFAPRIRLDMTVRNAKFPGERNVRETSDGKKQVYYGKNRKEKEFAAEAVPQYVMDFLSLIPISDHLFIDGIEHNVEVDEINISYPDSIQDFGQVTMMVSVKQQNRENRNIGNPSNILPATSGFIVDPVYRYIILTEPATGDTVKATI